jgi:hypothetical protein
MNCGLDLLNAITGTCNQIRESETLEEWNKLKESRFD